MYATSRSGDRRDGTSVIHALDAADGTERWNQTIADDVPPGPLPPVVAGPTVYGHAQRQIARAFDTENGGVRWTAEEWGASGAPPVVATDSEHLYHFDSSGITARDPGRSTVRRYLSWLPEAQWQGQPSKFFHGWPTTRDGAVYAPGEGTHDRNDGEMSAFAPDGSHRWNYEIDARATPPAVANGRLYLVRFRAVDRVEDQYQYEPTVVALDAEDGTERWDQGFEEPRPTDLRPVATDDVVYVCNAGNEVYAYDADDGTERWTTTVDGDIGAMATVDESLYVTTTEGTLYSLSA
ncbi:hypothetical protein JCM18750_10280 [Halostagnicola bangensis]